jgi:hypothetical protein
MKATWKQGRSAASRLVMSLSAVLVVGGCSAATFHWTKAGFGPQHAEQQLAACQLEAERSRYSSDEAEADRTARVERESRLCMKAGGWRWLPDTAEPVSEPVSEPAPQ